jgi:hypothetical protein
MQWRTTAFQMIEEMKPDIVVMVSASLFVEDGRHRNYERGVSIEEWRRATERTMRRLSAKSRLVLIRDNPIPWSSIPACLGGKSARPSWIPSSPCEMSRAECLNPRIFEAEKAAAANLKNVSLIDMTDQFCGKEVCWATKEGQIIYRDNNHLTGHFVDSVRTILESRLVRALKSMRTQSDELAETRGTPPLN